MLIKPLTDFRWASSGWNSAFYPPGDVLIQVAYAAVNYKDAPVCIPNGNVARASPLVPGLELTGVVVELTDPRFQFTRHLQKALHTASHMKW